MISSAPSTISEKISSFLDEKIFLANPFDLSQFQPFRIRDFLQPFLSDIQSSREIQDACTKIETSITGSYLANQVVNLHPIVNDKDIKIQFFVKPGTDKAALYMKIHTLARKHLVRQVCPPQWADYYLPLSKFGVRKDVYNPNVKGMGLGSIEILGDWGQAPLELSMLILDQPAFTHLTNVDSLYVPLEVFGHDLGSERPGEFLLRSREKGNLLEILSDLKKRVITSCKTDWDPVQLSHFELSRYFIWIVEKWTERGSAIFSNFALGSLDKASVKDLWVFLSNKVREKRLTFAGYPFFLLCNYLSHFSEAKDSCILQMLENEFTEILLSLPNFFRNLYPVLYSQENVSGKLISKLKPDAHFLLSCHLPLLSQRVTCEEHLERKILQCSFLEQNKEFSVAVFIPRERDEFKKWITTIYDCGRRQWVLHLLYLMENEIVDFICQSFYASDEEGSGALSWIFTLFPAKKQPLLALEIISQFRGADRSFVLAQCLSLLDIQGKKIFLQELAKKDENLFFQLLPHIQINLPVSQRTFLSYLINHVSSPSFYKTYIQTIEDPFERMEMVKYVFSCKNENEDIHVLKASLSLFPKAEKIAFLAEFLRQKNFSSWNVYLLLLEEEVEYVDLMQQLFPLLEEETFLAAFALLQQFFPIERELGFSYDVIVRLIPLLPQASSSFQIQCMNMLGNHTENWLHQIFFVYGEETFFRALSWILSFVSPQQREVYLRKLLICLTPHLSNATESFWTELTPILLPLVSDKKAWKDLILQLFMNISAFPSCFISLVEKSGLINLATVYNSRKPSEVSLKQWIFDLKLAALYKNSLYIQYNLKGELSKLKLQEIKKHFSSASLLKPVFNDLLEKSLWNEAAHFLNDLKGIFGVDEVLSWYVDYAKKNPTKAKAKEEHCLKALQESWQFEKAWDYYETAFSFPRVVSRLVTQGFPDPIHLPIEKKHLLVSNICTSLDDFIRGHRIDSALSLAQYLPSLEAQENMVAIPLIKIFENCQTKEQQLQVVNLMQKLAPSLTGKLINRFKDPYAEAVRVPLPISKAFSVDEWMLALLEVCLEETLEKQKILFAHMTQRMDCFLRKFPDEFPLLAGKYAEKMSLEEKEAFISALKVQVGEEKLAPLLRIMTLSSR